ncbi:MAG: hypothetical protein WC841_03540 [Candidatus Shapirobacteria bacterium]|jgi:hypothetical protein
MSSIEQLFNSPVVIAGGVAASAAVAAQIARATTDRVNEGEVYLRRNNITGKFSVDLDPRKVESVVIGMQAVEVMDIMGDNGQRATIAVDRTMREVLDDPIQFAAFRKRYGVPDADKRGGRSIKTRIEEHVPVRENVPVAATGIRFRLPWIESVAVVTLGQKFINPAEDGMRALVGGKNGDVEVQPDVLVTYDVPAARLPLAIQKLPKPVPRQGDPPDPRNSGQYALDEVGKAVSGLTKSAITAAFGKIQFEQLTSAKGGGVETVQKEIVAAFYDNFRDSGLAGIANVQKVQLQSIRTGEYGLTLTRLAGQAAEKDQLGPELFGQKTLMQAMTGGKGSSVIITDPGLSGFTAAQIAARNSAGGRAGGEA